MKKLEHSREVCQEWTCISNNVCRLNSDSLCPQKPQQRRKHNHNAPSTKRNISQHRWDCCCYKFHATLCCLEVKTTLTIPPLQSSGDCRFKLPSGVSCRGQDGAKGAAGSAAPQPQRAQAHQFQREQTHASLSLLPSDGFELWSAGETGTEGEGRKSERPRRKRQWHWLVWVRETVCVGLWSGSPTAWAEARGNRGWSLLLSQAHRTQPW